MKKFNNLKEMELKRNIEKQKMTLDNYQWNDKADLENAIFGEKLFGEVL